MDTTTTQEQGTEQEQDSTTELLLRTLARIYPWAF